MNASTVTAVAALLVAIIGGGFGVLNSTRANRPAESNAQLAWVKAAQDEAREAREEAKEAKLGAAAAARESDETRVQAVKLRREFDAMQDWVDRVVRARDAYMADLTEAGRSIEDSGVLRILRAINGGPRIEPK